MTHFYKTFFAAVVSLSCISIHALARPQSGDATKDAIKFEQLVPQDAWLVLSLDNAKASDERWSATPLGKWFKSDPVQAFLKDTLATQARKSKDRMQELGVPEDSWSWPDSFGVGLYLAHDDMLDADLPHILACAAWGDRADKVNTLFEAILTEMQKKDVASVSSIEIRGKPAKAIRVRDLQEPPKKRRSRRTDSFVPEGSLDHIETIYFVRDGNRFLLGSVKDDLEEALGVYAGIPRKSVADSADFQKTLDSVGRGDVWMVMLTSALHKVAGAGGAQVELIQPYLQTLFGDVLGYGFSLASDAPGAQFQVLSGIVIDGDRKGLLALINPAKSPSEPPSFVGDNATGYGTVNTQFGEIMKLVEMLVSSIPEELSQPFDASLQQYGPDLSRALAKLGPDMHIVRSKIADEFLILPDGRKATLMNTSESYYAVRCSDEKSMMTLMNLFLPQAGFEPRDFNGNTIFDDDSRQTSFGFGSGWVFTGQSRLVESVLRSVSSPNLPSNLASTPVCKQVVADLGTAPVLCWGYQDILIDFSKDKAPVRDNSPGISTGYQSNTFDKVGASVPMDLIFILFEDDTSNWKSAMGPNVFSMTSESFGLMTKIRVLPPTTP